MYIELIAAIMATITGLLFAVNVLLVRRATISGEPLDAVLAMMVIGTIVYVPLAFIFYYPNPELNIRSILAFSNAGIAGTFFGRTCYYEATRRVGASRTVTVSRGSLITSSLIGVFLLGETITMGHSVGIVILLIGVMIVSYKIESRNEETEFESKLSILFLLGPIIFWGLPAPSVSFGLSTGTPLLVGMAIEFTAGLIALSAYYAIRGYSPVRFIHQEHRHLFLWAGILYTVGIGILNTALSISRVVVIMPFRSLTPLFTLILSYLFLKKLESITKALILGAVLAVLGSILIGISM